MRIGTSWFKIVQPVVDPKEILTSTAQPVTVPTTTMTTTLATSVEVIPMEAEINFIAGGVGLFICIVALICICSVIFCCRKRKNRQNQYVVGRYQSRYLTDQFGEEVAPLEQRSELLPPPPPPPAQPTVILSASAPSEPLSPPSTNPFERKDLMEEIRAAYRERHQNEEVPY